MKRQSNTEGTITSFNRPSKGSQTDRGWAWIILPATVMTCFLIIGYIKSYGLFIVEFARVYDCSASMASLLQGIQAGVNSITSTITLTWGLRHMSSRQFVVIGGCIYFLGYILGSFAPNIELMIIPHGLVLGVGMGMAMGPAIVITGQYFERWRGLATGLIMAGGSLGGLVLPFMLQYLFEEYGLRGTLLLTGGIMLHLLLFGGLMRPYASNKVKASTENETLLQKTEIPQGEVIDMHVLKISQQNDMLLPLSDLKHKRSISKSNCSINDVLASLSNLATSNSRMDVNDKSYKLITTNRKNNGERDSTSDELMCRKVDNTKLTLIEEIVFLLKNKLLLIMIVSSVLVTPGCFLIGVYIPPHAERLGFSDKELPLLVSIAGGADLVGRVVCSLTADTGWMKNYNRIAIALIITGLSSLLVSFYVDFISMAVFACVYGVFGGIYFVLFPVVLVDFIGLERFPASLGIINLVHGVSIGISMPILGLICDAMGSYLEIFYILGTCLVLGGCVLLFSNVVQKMEDGSKITDQIDYMLTKQRLNDHGTN